MNFKITASILSLFSILSIQQPAEAALQRQWGTYFGGSDIDRASDHASALNSAGEVILAGHTFSDDGIAFMGDDPILDGNKDGFIAKFNASGQRVWSTYFGGEGDDQIYDVAVDKLKNIYVVGVTSSEDLATPGAFDTELDGDFDSFIAKFNNDGKLLWATYYGGEAMEGGQNSITVDKNGTLYITGITQSTTGMTTGGSHDQSFNGGEWDVFVAAFDLNGDRLWGTYYGGTEDDGADNTNLAADVRMDIASTSRVDSNGSVTDKVVVITGDTRSPDGIATSGTHQTSKNGNQDVFVASFKGETGKLNWGTYYGGHEDDDAGSLAINARGEIYLSGMTASSQDIATPGAFKTSLSGDLDGFLAKFSPDGDLMWATYFGGPESMASDQESIQSIALDNQENIYAVGMTRSTSGIVFNPKWAYDSTYAVGEKFNEFDLFVAKFKKNGSLEGSSYYGGTGREWMASVLVKPTFTNNIIYVTGTTLSKNAMVSPGAFDSMAQGEEAFIAKFIDNTAVIQLGF